MPQINVYNYLSQTTWTIILFSLYYYNMKQYLIPSIIEKIKVRINLLTRVNTGNINKNSRVPNLFINKFDSFNTDYKF